MKSKVLISPDTDNVPLDVTDSLKELAEVEYVKRPYEDKPKDAYAVLVDTEPLGQSIWTRRPN